MQPFITNFSFDFSITDIFFSDDDQNNNQECDSSTQITGVDSERENVLTELSSVVSEENRSENELNREKQVAPESESLKGKFLMRFSLQ